MSVFRVAAIGLLLAVPAGAFAQADPDPNMTGWSAADFQIRMQRLAGMSWKDVNEQDIKLHFNRARCECGEQIRFLIELTTTGRAKQTAIAEELLDVVIGPTDCAADQSQVRANAACLPKLTDVDLTDLRANGAVMTTTATELFSKAPMGRTGGCSADIEQKVWILLKNKSGDLLLKEGSAPSLSIRLDGEAPAPPRDVVVRGGNEALEVKWDAVRATDFEGYVVLCARAGAYPVYKQTYYDGKFHTAASVCDRSVSPTARERAVFGARKPEDGEVSTAPDTFFRLDTAFVCSEMIPSGTSARLSGLQNGIPYAVGVASVDERGNASPIQDVVVQVPIPTRDFYRGYREAGGEAEGGYCAYGRRGGRSAALILGAAALAVIGLRRKRRGS